MSRYGNCLILPLLICNFLTRPKGEKIARAKNNCHDLSNMAKKVGSNYYLFNRRLSANLNYAFAALSAGVRQLAEASAVSTSDSISFLVTPVRIQYLDFVSAQIFHRQNLSRTVGSHLKVSIYEKIIRNWMIFS